MKTLKDSRMLRARDQQRNDLVGVHNRRDVMPVYKMWTTYNAYTDTAKGDFVTALLSS